jgi:uncharacterized membrane protein
MRRAGQGLRLERAGRVGVALIVALVFVARWLLADQQSYWLDELLSVDTYGVGSNKSLAQAIERLGRGSIHPPLYQSILYGWMKLWGDHEGATRTLSNVYVSAAAVCLYFAAERRIGVRRAVMSVLFFSLMNVPLKYALETRSYGQSLFLSTLSSWALLELLGVLALRRSWRAALASRPALVVMAANFLLLMTHYYNAFFLAAQGVFALAWMLRQPSPEPSSGAGAVRARLVDLLKLAAPLVLPLIAQLAVWGPVMARSYQKHTKAKAFVAASEGVQEPFGALWRYAVAPTLRDVPTALLVALGVLALVFLAKQVVLMRRVQRAHPTGRSTFIAYSITTALGSFVVAWALFTASGHERYVDRYFAFTAPAIAVLFVLVLEQAVSPLGRLFRNRWLARSYLRWSALYAIVALGLFMPSAYRLVTRPKADWRGTARLIADITAADPGHKYAVYSVGFTSFPSLDYYFRRYGSKAKVAEVIKQKAAEKGEFPFARDRKHIEKHDFMIVAFTHLPASKFPKTLAKLAKRYDVHTNLIQNDEGIVIYRVKPDAP